MPGETAGTGGRLLVVGTDHRTAPTAWRDQFALIEANLSSELDRLRAKGFRDLTLLATCERVELITLGPYAGLPKPHRASRRLAGWPSFPDHR